jgi:hypothetical protein
MDPSLAFPADDPGGPPAAAPAAAVEPPARAEDGFRRHERVLFRFVALYLVLYILPFPCGELPLQWLPERAQTWFYGHTVTPWAQGKDACVKWVGKHLFHLDITILPRGSGDTTWNYVELLCFAAAALAGGLLWTGIDALFHARRYHRRVHDFWTTYVRFKLATTMLSYGAFKVIKSQFAAPTIDALLEPLGEMSPMGLCWSFMGFSTGYTMFTGAAEMLGGLLLTLRRTTALGALVTLGVMANVVALNFFYDVPVKLFSSHLLLMAFVLLAPNLRALGDLFLRGRPAAMRAPRRLFAPRALHVAGVVVGLAFLGWSAWRPLKMSWEGLHQYGDLAPRAPSYGRWDVEVFEVDGEMVPEESPGERWRRVSIGVYSVGLEHRDGRFERLFGQVQGTPPKLTLTRTGDTSWSSKLKVDLSEPDRLVLEGPFDGHALRVECARGEEREDTLMARGFHWINEFPFNR